MIHDEPHPLAGQTVALRLVAPDPSLSVPEGTPFRVEDWWDRVSGGSWMHATGNPAALNYAMRTGFAGRVIPLDDQVVYGKVGPFGLLVHVSELREAVPA
jgi:hypothetical protein